MVTDTSPANDTPATVDTDVASTGEKSFLEKAQEAIEDAVESTVEAVKEHPIAAAGIAAGVAAAVGGAAYAASKLLGGSDDEESKG